MEKELEEEDRKLLVHTLDDKNNTGPFDDLLTPTVKKSKYVGYSPETRREKKMFLEELKLRQSKRAEEQNKKEAKELIKA